MKRISGKRMVQILKKRGWQLDRINGSHRILNQPGNPVLISAPFTGTKHSIKDFNDLL